MLKDDSEYKELGALKFTFTALEALLDMNLHSILTVEVDPLQQQIRIIHNDPGRGAWKVAEGGTILNTQLQLTRLQIHPVDLITVEPRLKEEDNNGGK
jgi:hypothetical protein